MSEQPDWGAYPSRERAYAAAAVSFRATLDRVKAADDRLQHLQTIASTMLLAVPAVLRAVQPQMDLASWPSLVIFAAGFAAITLAGFMRSHGKVVLDSPAVLREHYAGMDEARFYMDLLHYTAENYEANKRLAALKARASVLISFLVTTQLAVAGAWLVFEQ